MEKYAVIYTINGNREIIEANLILSQAVILAYRLNKYAIKGSRYSYQPMN